MSKTFLCRSIFSLIELLKDFIGRKSGNACIPFGNLKKRGETLFSFCE